MKALGLIFFNYFYSLKNDGKKRLYVAGRVSSHIQERERICNTEEGSRRDLTIRPEIAGQVTKVCK